MYPVSFSDFSSPYLTLPPPSLELRSTSAPASLSPFWNGRPRLRTTLSVEDDEDDDLNIDTSNMTQEEKNDLKAQRKLRKMNREKLKRSKVNDQFDHLCRVLHVGKTTRVEKLTVLNETLRTVYQLKAENKMLKEQTRQLKELRARRQSGEPVYAALHALVHSPGSNQEAKAVPSKHDRGKPEGQMNLASIRGMPPPAEMRIKESFFEDPFVKQEMMNFGKHDPVFPKQVPSEESMMSWNAMFEQPQQNDLDFAFGDSTFMWNPPRQDGMAFPKESECEFGSFVIPKPDHDSMDLFLTTSDDCDLLC